MRIEFWQSEWAETEEAWEKIYADYDYYIKHVTDNSGSGLLLNVG